MVVRFSQHTIGFRPFRFYNFWTLKEVFLKTVKEVWDIQIDGVKSFQTSQKLNVLKGKLRKLYGKDQLQTSLAIAESELFTIQA